MHFIQSTRRTSQSHSRLCRRPARPRVACRRSRSLARRQPLHAAARLSQRTLSRTATSAARSLTYPHHRYTIVEACSTQVDHHHRPSPFGVHLSMHFHPHRARSMSRHTQLVLAASPPLSLPCLCTRSSFTRHTEGSGAYARGRRIGNNLRIAPKGRGVATCPFWIADTRHSPGRCATAPSQRATAPPEHRSR